MALRTWGKVLSTALGAAATAAAGQLGVGYGLGLVRLARDFAGTSAYEWYGQLAWVAWFAMVATVLGALVGTRMAHRHGVAPGPGGVLGIAFTAGIGALVTAPLTMQPARTAQLAPALDPVLTVGLTAVLGAIAGTVLATAALSGRLIAWNMLGLIGVIWALGLISVAPSLGPNDAPPTVRLAVLDLPSWSASATRLGALVGMPALALLLGMSTAAAALPRSRSGRSPETLSDPASAAAGPGGATADSAVSRSARTADQASNATATSKDGPTPRASTGKVTGKARRGRAAPGPDAASPSGSETTSQKPNSSAETVAEPTGHGALANASTRPPADAFTVPSVAQRVFRQLLANRGMALGGIAGPAVLALAYLLAGPGDSAAQSTPYFAALATLAAGTFGSTAVTALPALRRVAVPIVGTAGGSEQTAPDSIAAPGTDSAASRGKGGRRSRAGTAGTAPSGANKPAAAAPGSTAVGKASATKAGRARAKADDATASATRTAATGQVTAQPSGAPVAGAESPADDSRPRPRPRPWPRRRPTPTAEQGGNAAASGAGTAGRPAAGEPATGGATVGRRAGSSGKQDSGSPPEPRSGSDRRSWLPSWIKKSSEQQPTDTGAAGTSGTAAQAVVPAQRSGKNKNRKGSDGGPKQPDAAGQPARKPGPAPAAAKASATTGGDPSGESPRSRFGRLRRKSSATVPEPPAEQVAPRDEAYVDWVAGLGGTHETRTDE